MDKCIEEMCLETLDDLKAFLRTNHLQMEVGSACPGKWGATISQCNMGVIAAAEREDFATAVRAAVRRALAILERDHTHPEQGLPPRRNASSAN